MTKYKLFIQNLKKYLYKGKFVRESIMRINRILKIIEDVLPAGTAMDGDRIGLQVQAGKTDVRKLLFTLELNDKVIEEAVSLDIDCIITFHPLIFMPLTSIRDNDRVGRLCTKLISSLIALISIHTNFDAFSEGTSKILADRLQLQVVDFLEPDRSYENYGMGVMARPSSPIKAVELLERVASVCNSPIRYCHGRKELIENIAIVGGSGTSFLNSVIANKADAFITADVTYHKFHQVNGEIMMIDPGHYEMEQFVPMGLMEILKKKFGDEEIDDMHLSSVHTNPVNYFPGTEEYRKLQTNYLINNNT